MSDALESLDAQGQGEVEVEVEAKKLGWADKEHWRGDPDHWVDAETFVRRGKEFMPLLKAQNKQLEDRLAAASRDLTDTKQTVEELRTTINDLTAFQAEEIRKGVERKIEELKTARKAAREEEDPDLVDEITDQIQELKAKGAALKKQEAKPEPKKAEPEGIDPVFAKWAEGRDWLKDTIKQSLAVGVAQKLRQDGDKTIGVEFFDKVEAGVEEILNAPKRSKMEGSGGGSSGKGSEAGSRYADLPPEAKAACDAEASRFVGPNKAFKDVAAWRAHYAKIYSES